MPVFKIHHVTKYDYDYPVKESCNEIKIYPFLSAEQTVLQHEIQVSHHPDIQVYKDYWGNLSGLFQVVQLHSQLIIDSRLTIQTNGFDAQAIKKKISWKSVSAATQQNIMLLENAKPDPLRNASEISAIIKQIFRKNASVIDICEACNQYIFQNFKYKKGITSIETTVDEILETKMGVCQDFAHLMLQILRTIGLPSRYVSGYICPNKNGMRGEGATHAWVEVFIPQVGWIGIDPTNNTWVTDNHVKLAVGRHFYDCTPVKGVFKGLASQQLSVFVSVGYEDGQVFEEMNLVNLNFEVIDGKPVAKSLNPIDVQHQQQQQQ